MFGREIAVPLDVMMADEETEEEEERIQYGEFTSNLENHLTQAYREVRPQLGIAQRRQKDNYDRGIKGEKIQPGDRVLLFSAQLKETEASKFHRLWTGPYVIKERITDMTYKIKKENHARSRSKVVHFNNLKPLKKLRRPTNKDDIQETPEEEPAASDSEHELIAVTAPNTEDDLFPDRPQEQEEQGHQLPDVSVQDTETSGMENMESDSDEESLPDSPTENLFVSAGHPVGLRTM